MLGKWLHQQQHVTKSLNLTLSSVLVNFSFYLCYMLPSYSKWFCLNWWVCSFTRSYCTFHTFTHTTGTGTGPGTIRTKYKKYFSTLKCTKNHNWTSQVVQISHWTGGVKVMVLLTTFWVMLLDNHYIPGSLFWLSNCDHHYTNGNPCTFKCLLM